MKKHSYKYQLRVFEPTLILNHLQKLFKVKPDVLGQPKALVINRGAVTDDALKKSDKTARFEKKNPNFSQNFINHNQFNPDADVKRNREILKLLLRRKQMGHFVHQVFLNAVSFGLLFINSVFIVSISR